MRKIDIPEAVPVLDLEGLPVHENGQVIPPITFTTFALNVLGQQGQVFASGLDPFDAPEILRAVVKKVRDGRDAPALHLENDEWARLLTAVRVYQQHPIVAMATIVHMRAIRDAQNYEAAATKPT